MNDIYQIAIRQLVSQFYKNRELQDEVNQMSSCVTIDWDQLPPLSCQVSATVSACGMLTTSADVDDWFLSQIHGSRVSELQTCAKITPYMLFLISQLNANTYSSYNCEYTTLSSQFLHDSLDKFNVKTMAFEDKWLYSRHDHNHDKTYTQSLTITPQYTLPDQEIATFALSDEHFTPLPKVVMSYPLVQPPVPAEPDIGTLRFCASPSLTSTHIEITSDQFDGWVYADGHTYENVDTQQFAKAIDAYGIRDNAFTVPNITSFFRLCSLGDDDINQTYPQQIGLKHHTHKVSNLSATGDLNYNPTKQDPLITTANSTKTGYHYHYGKNTDQLVTFTSTIDFSTSPIHGFKTRVNGVDPSTTTEKYYPNHNKIPVMVYIGGRKKPYKPSNVI